MWIKFFDVTLATPWNICATRKCNTEVQHSHRLEVHDQRQCGRRFSQNIWSRIRDTQTEMKTACQKKKRNLNIMSKKETELDQQTTIAVAIDINSLLCITWP
jgi:hypothetical protein